MENEFIKDWNTRATPDHTELLKMARDALERAKNGLEWYGNEHPEHESEADAEEIGKINKVLVAIDAALGEQKEE